MINIINEEREEAHIITVKTRLNIIISQKSGRDAARNRRRRAELR